MPPPPPPMSRVVRVKTNDPHLPSRHGVVQRSTLQSKATPSPPRPRASMIQVKTLYQAIAGLCRELVPLSTERRSRRFWTLWRERSGGMGIGRSEVEALLKSTSDARVLAASLIAEVHDVDLNSVMTLLNRLDDVSSSSELPEPLASIRIQGVPADD